MTIISEYLKSRDFSFNTETKLFTVDASGEMPFDLDVNDIRALMNMFKLLDDNKLL